MKQLNTSIKIHEVKYQKNSLSYSSFGFLDINYFGNEISNKNEISVIVDITKEFEAFNINLNVDFSYESECSKCLSKENKLDNVKFNKSFSVSTDNDYDINFNNESIDILPIISEIIISKMDFKNICKKDCKGLCNICGKDQNNYICSHKEKNIKESPFSSLSELDL